MKYYVLIPAVAPRLTDESSNKQPELNLLNTLYNELANQSPVNAYTRIDDVSRAISKTENKFGYIYQINAKTKRHYIDATPDGIRGHVVKIPFKDMNLESIRLSKTRPEWRDVSLEQVSNIEAADQAPPPPPTPQQQRASFFRRAFIKIGKVLRSPYVQIPMLGLMFAAQGGTEGVIALCAKLGFVTAYPLLVEIGFAMLMGAAIYGCTQLLLAGLSYPANWLYEKFLQLGNSTPQNVSDQTNGLQHGNTPSAELENELRQGVIDLTQEQPVLFSGGPAATQPEVVVKLEPSNQQEVEKTLGASNRRRA